MLSVNVLYEDKESVQVCLFVDAVCIQSLFALLLAYVSKVSFRQRKDWGFFCPFTVHRTSCWQGNFRHREESVWLNAATVELVQFSPVSLSACTYHHGKMGFFAHSVTTVRDTVSELASLWGQTEGRVQRFGAVRCTSLLIAAMWKRTWVSTINPCQKVFLNTCSDSGAVSVLTLRVHFSVCVTASWLKTFTGESSVQKKGLDWWWL